MASFPLLPHLLAPPSPPPSLLPTRPLPFARDEEEKQKTREGGAEGGAEEGAEEGVEEEEDGWGWDQPVKDVLPSAAAAAAAAAVPPPSFPPPCPSLFEGGGQGGRERGGLEEEEVVEAYREVIEMMGGLNSDQVKVGREGGRDEKEATPLI